MTDRFYHFGFSYVWVYDFEYSSDGHLVVRCLVAYNLLTGEFIQIVNGQFSKEPPFSLERDSLFVSYHAPAEMICHRALGWPQPTCVLDLLPEVRNHFNGQLKPGEKLGLLDCASRFGIGTISPAAKIFGRQLSMKQGELSTAEMEQLLEYCASDVITTAKLLIRLLPQLDLVTAIAFRSRYTALAVTAIEGRGTPIDVYLLDRLRKQWPEILRRLVARVDPNQEVYDSLGQFSERRWMEFTSKQGISWPLFLTTGRPVLNRKAFNEMASLYPSIEPFRQLRNTLAQFKSGLLQRQERLDFDGTKSISTVDPDGRNRCALFPFSAKTGRNQPSSTGFIFGCPSWLRFLIKPQPGNGLAYIDIEQEEFGIAASLSRDPAMIDAYNSGDPYLAFGKQVGQIPPNVTKESHGADRERFKQCALGIGYGMQAPTLVRKLNESIDRAEELIRCHRKTYLRFWDWMNNELAAAVLRGYIRTRKFGWTLHVDSHTKRGTLLNFHMQATGAEILQVASIRCAEAGISVCAPVHDALLIEASLDELDEVVMKTRTILEESSSFVLDGFRLRTEAYVVRYPDRFEDPKGRALWDTVMDILFELEAEAGRQCA